MLDERALVDHLKQFGEFEKFFVEVSRLKTVMDIQELRHLRKILQTYDFGYSTGAIVYLCDCLASEIILTSNQRELQYTEYDFKHKIVERFQDYFPGMQLVQTEYVVPNIGRIDILAKDLPSGRPVIVELKVKAKSPNKQLLAYAQAFDNPILIGVTEQPVRDKLSGIAYFTYKELGISKHQD